MTGRTLRPGRVLLALLTALALLATGPRHAAAQRPAPRRRPANVLLVIADDWSFPHASAYGDPVVRTPNVDRVARQGVLFTHAFVSSPSCTPSRAALLAGQDVWRLGEGANLWSVLPAATPTYPDLLAQAGYVVGHSGKGWGPGRNDGAAAGRTHNPAGPKFASFAAFLAARPAGRPFAFWVGSSNPHRPYEPATRAAAGLATDRLVVPAFLPDVPAVRADLLDYYAEVERFDRELGEALRALEAAGELPNTLVVVTGDNGMPFPRAKTNLYDAGTHVPLAVMWPGAAAGGRVVADFVNLADLAPTFLEAAGRPVPRAMTGRSLRPMLLSGRQGQVEAARDFVVTGRERHARVRTGNVGYPSRAIRTRDYLYVVNFAPDRWPAGDPDLATGPQRVGGGPPFTARGYGDIDNSPSKDALVAGAQAEPYRFMLSVAKRPAEELYVLAADPDQLRNVADAPVYAGVKAELRRRLMEHLRRTGDPRATGGGAEFDRYPYYSRRDGPETQDPAPGAREARTPVRQRQP